MAQAKNENSGLTLVQPIPQFCKMESGEPVIKKDRHVEKTLCHRAYLLPKRKLQK